MSFKMSRRKLFCGIGSSSSSSSSNCGSTSSSTVVDPKLSRQKSKVSDSDSNLEDSDKRSGPFTLFKKTSKKKGTSTISFFGDFKDFLEYLRSNLFEITENELVSFKGSHWSTIGNFQENMTDSENEMIKQAKLSQAESTRFEALWELFYAELTYLADNLLVLQDVFLRTLEHAKKYGFLLSIEENILFGNLEELVKVTTAFATMMLEIFKECGASISRSTEIIVDGFKEFPNLLTPQYRDYCLNYQQALIYLKRIKEDDDNFHEFIKICEDQKRCARRQLEDLLVSPLQHLTKYPLLLKAIRKRTPKDDPNHDQLSDTIVNLEESIKSIEVTFSREVNMLRLKEINSSLQWPLLADTDNKFSIPEFIRLELVNTTHCDPLLENPDRMLLHEGGLILNDSSKMDVYIFLFSDIILITKVRKKVKRPNTSNSDESDKKPHYKASIKGGTLENNMQYIVYKQPIPISNIKLFDCDETSGVKTGFCLVQFNNFHQVLYVYTLQASSDDIKTQWLSHIRKALRSNRVSVEVTDCSTSNHVSSDEDLASITTT